MQPQDFGNIVIFGDAGKGKTALCSAILGKNIGESASTECAGGATGFLDKYDGRWRNEGPQITVYDMPGFGDLRKKAIDIVGEWRKILAGQVFTAVCFVVRVDDHRFTTFQELALKIFELCVQSSHPWGSIIFVGTHTDKLDPEDGTAEKRLNDFIKKANELIQSDGGIKRKVWISLKKNRALDESGLQQLEGHLLDLVNKRIQFNEERASARVIQAITRETVIGEGQEHCLNCFDGDMNVKVFKNGEIKSAKLIEVELLDLIQVNNGAFEPVMILSRHIDKPVPVLHFEMEDKEKGKRLELRLVGYHFMYIIREKETLHLPARKVTVNDKLLHFSEDGTVALMQITRITTKIAIDTVNVRTRSRTVVVNDVCCSSVVEGDAGTLGHYIALACGKIHKKLPNEANKLVVSLKSIYNGVKNL